MKRCEMERRGCMGRLQRRFVHQYVFCIKTQCLRVSVLGIAYFYGELDEICIVLDFCSIPLNNVPLCLQT